MLPNQPASNSADTSPLSQQETASIAVSHGPNSHYATSRYTEPVLLTLDEVVEGLQEQIILRSGNAFVFASRRTEDYIPKYLERMGATLWQSSMTPCEMLDRLVPQRRAGSLLCKGVNPLHTLPPSLEVMAAYKETGANDGMTWRETSTFGFSWRAVEVSGKPVSVIEVPFSSGIIVACPNDASRRNEAYCEDNHAISNYENDSSKGWYSDSIGSYCAVASTEHATCGSVQITARRSFDDAPVIGHFHVLSPNEETGFRSLAATLAELPLKEISISLSLSTFTGVRTSERYNPELGRMEPITFHAGAAHVARLFSRLGFNVVTTLPRMSIDTADGITGYLPGHELKGPVSLLRICAGTRGSRFLYYDSATPC